MSKDGFEEEIRQCFNTDDQLRNYSFKQLDLIEDHDKTWRRSKRSFAIGGVALGVMYLTSGAEFGEFTMRGALSLPFVDWAFALSSVSGMVNGIDSLKTRRKIAKNEDAALTYAITNNEYAPPWSMHGHELGLISQNIDESELD